ncbi:MAG: VanZ family protein [Oscillospiraceae bacterium]|nr:VanZ family protein [Oscillospiraceae bacterium]
MSALRRKRVLNLLLGLLLAATLCFIWGNSLLPRSESTQISSGLFARLLPLFQALGLDMIDEHMLRKLAHFGEFAVLGCELAALFILNRGRCSQSACFAALCALFTGAADETIQLFSGRAAMLTDVLLDFSGALAGIALVYLLTAHRKTEQKKRTAA